MERFATNKNGNIDSGTEVLANNMVFLQQAKANAISNLYGDLFTEGILNNGNPDTMFKISANNDGTINVSAGVGYIKDYSTTPSIYERIAITDSDEEYNAANATQLTPDGAGQYVLTPKSSGCKNIPIPNTNTEYYVYINYLSVCDNGNTGDNLGLKNYSIAKSESSDITIQRKRFYKWIDGYQIVLVPKPQKSIGICAGVVNKDSNNNITITTENRTDNLLIQSRVFMEYFNAGQGIEFKDVGEQTLLSVNVDNATIEINEDNQVSLTKDGQYPYTKFAMNSGPSSFLIGSENTVTLTIADTPMWLSPAYADRYSIVNMSSSINVWTVVQERFSSNPGIYTVCINNTDITNNNNILTVPQLELMGNIIVSTTQPTQEERKNFDIWLDMSSQPYKAKWYYGGTWLEYNGVPVGSVNWIDTVTGIDINTNLMQFNFNKDYTQWNTIGDMKINFQPENPDITKYIIGDGSSVLKFLYYDLYRKIGDTYGTPTLTPEQSAIDSDITHYFVLPDLRGKVIWGGEDYANITYLEAGLPNITGADKIGYSGYYEGVGNNYSATGALQGTKLKTGGSTVIMTRTDQWSVGSGVPLGVSIDASKSNSIYGNSATVQPPALQIPVLIKYTV